MNNLGKVSIGVTAVISLALMAGCASGGGSAASGSGNSSTRSKSKIVDVTMSDMAFSPSKLTVRKGDTITFRFHNKGVVMHEAVIGDAAAQQEHAAAMQAATTAASDASAKTNTTVGGASMHDGTAMDSMTAGSSMPMTMSHDSSLPMAAAAPSSTPATSNHDHAHGEATPLVVVKPGKTGTLTATFDSNTTLQIGCHQPGHYEAGMKATLTIS